MFWDVLDRPRQDLLTRTVENMPVPGSYLAGGTALALVLGHRKSIDLSYFDDAEREVMPLMLQDISWQSVKEYFLAGQKRLLNKVKA